MHASDKLSMVQAIDHDGLGDEFRVLHSTSDMSVWCMWLICRARRFLFWIFGFTYHFLDHVHDFLLDQIQALGVACRRAANDIVNLDIVVLFANATPVHGVGEFDEDGVLFHDALNVLATYSNDTLVVLVRYVEGDRSRHLLLNEVETVFGGVVLCSTDVDVEIILVEAIEDDLDVA